jgi:hypothetical protein
MLFFMSEISSSQEPPDRVVTDVDATFGQLITQTSHGNMGCLGEAFHDEVFVGLKKRAAMAAHSAGLEGTGFAIVPCPFGRTRPGDTEPIRNLATRPTCQNRHDDTLTKIS